MIKSVRIQNFQSHKDSEFIFSPTTNSIVGSSNHGKTAVLRAITWAVTNRPSGDAFLSNWARNEKGNQIEDVSVTIVTDKDTITRVKGKNGNYYLLNGKKLEAIGVDVPEEISTAFNMNEVNIQKQMDAPFLLSESPGEVARFLNKTVHLDLIDTYLVKIESKKRKTKNELEVAKGNLEKTIEELGHYSWIEKAKKLIEKIQEKEVYIAFLSTSIKALEDGIYLWNKNEETLSTTSIIPTAEMLVEGITTLCTARDMREVEYNSLFSSVSNYKTVLSTIKDTPDIEYSEKLCRRISKIIDGEKNRESSLQSLNLEINSMKICMATLDTFDKEMDILVESLGNTCPLCGSSLEDK